MTAYGFIMEDGKGRYETNILDDEFRFCVFVAENGEVDTDLFEMENGEPYVLYKTNASGSYVGKIREAVETALRDIGDRCF